MIAGLEMAMQARHSRESDRERDNHAVHLHELRQRRDEHVIRTISRHSQQERNKETVRRIDATINVMDVMRLQMGTMREANTATKKMAGILSQEKMILGGRSSFEIRMDRAATINSEQQPVRKSLDCLDRLPKKRRGIPPTYEDNFK